MANPAEGNLHKPSRSGAASNGVAQGSARFSPDELDRLAAGFMPSWESEELGSSENDAYASQHPLAPPARTDVHEPENSVIIDRSITSADIDAGRSPPPAPSGAKPASKPPAALAVAAVSEAIPLVNKRVSSAVAVPAARAVSDPPRPVSARPAPPLPARAAPAARAAQARDLEEDVGVPKKSKTGLLVMLGVAAAVVVGGIGIAATSGGGTAAQPVAATTTGTATTTAKPERLEKAATTTPTAATTTAAAIATTTSAPPPAATTQPAATAAPAPQPEPTTKPAPVAAAPPAWAAPRPRPTYNTSAPVAPPRPVAQPVAPPRTEIVKKPDF